MRDRASDGVARMGPDEEVTRIDPLIVSLEIDLSTSLPSHLQQKSMQRPQPKSEENR